MKIHFDELKYLKQLQIELQIEDSAEILNWQTNRLYLKDIENINFSSMSNTEKKHILFLAESIAKIDGIYAEEEKEFIGKLSKLLNLENINQ